MRQIKPTKKQADTLFAKVIKKDALCKACGTATNLQCAHLISRSYYATRYDLNNAVPLCQKDHMYYTYHPLEWTQWCVDYLGEGGWDDLRKKALSHDKVDYKETIAYLKGLL